MNRGVHVYLIVWLFVAATTVESVARISGKVVDANTSEAIEGAWVRVTDPVREAVTDVEGRFEIELTSTFERSLPPGFPELKKQRVSVVDIKGRAFSGQTAISRTESGSLPRGIFLVSNGHHVRTHLALEPRAVTPSTSNPGERTAQATISAPPVRYSIEVGKEGYQTYRGKIKENEETTIKLTPSSSPSDTGEGVNPSCYSSTAPSITLAKAINDYRAQNGLPAIPYSGTLFEVAELHTRDCEQNSPVGGSCNLHSWSDHSANYGYTWSACCYTEDHAERNCMWIKPEEISAGTYTSNGYEISAWCGSGCTAATALGLWKNSSGHNNVILNKGGWANYEWKSLGASMYGAYAVVWFAKAADPDTVAICP